MITARNLNSGNIDSGQDATTLHVLSAKEDEAQDWKMVKHIVERIVGDALTVAEGKCKSRITSERCRLQKRLIMRRIGQ